ncbi:MAG TPA: pyrroloquinoline-quinone synthase PqqC, partial [Polyangia bacterium]|nr:pyrroloquinoline-quinone synthase PqqC [Polyangia bacterium]
MSASDRDLSPWPAEDFVARLRAEGVRRYHDQHPFHQRMHAGALSRRELQTWTLNRYYYQTRIPIKDALIVSKSEDPAFRRAWIRRVHDHDGDAPETGGLALWLRLAEAVGLDRDEVASCRRVLPGVRFACDAYVTLCRESPLVVAVASSLTEMFAPDLMSKRIAAWEQHYPWVGAEALAY